MTQGTYTCEKYLDNDKGFTVKHPHDKHKDEDNDKDKVEDKEVSPLTVKIV